MRTRLASVIALAATAAAIGGCSATTPAASADAASAAPTTAAAATLNGLVVLPVPDFEVTDVKTTAIDAMNAGDQCDGVGDYQQVTAGLSVAVTGAAGQQLATTTLYPGTIANYPDDDSGFAACEFTISASVASDAGTYTVTVGSFGKATYTLSQLGSVTVLLGQ